MIRVLHVINAMGPGGTEAFIMNVYRNIDRHKVQFDFVEHTQQRCFYDDEIEALGGRIYRTFRFNVANYVPYRKWWDEFFDEHREYPIVHGHINSSAAVYLASAKRHGVMAVVHSHSTRSPEHSVRATAFRIMSYPIRNIADYFFACSRKAGIDRFGPKVVDGDCFQVINNGIDYQKFAYDSEVRNDIRGRMGVSDKHIIGHVGRFDEQKNHRFVIDVYKEAHDTDPKTELWLIGQGGLRGEIEKKVASLDLGDSVRFLGVTDKVGEYLQGMDTFIFPSINEGLGIALVEAQAAGLPCVVSQSIQPEADIGAGLIKKLDLGDDIVKWRDAVVDALQKPRSDTSGFVREAGYDIYDVAELLQRFYLDYGSHC